MGRHSSSDQVAFYRSAVAWFLPWVVIAAVVGIAVWIAVDAVSQDSLSKPPPAARGAGTPEGTPTAAPASPRATATVSPEPPATDAPSATPAPLITDGISVQVLNATNVAEADDRMADKLAGLGFEVVALDAASSSYGKTTVFWSFESAREAAERLAARFGWVAEERPSNLSSGVDIHLVVGTDEAL